MIKSLEWSGHAIVYFIYITCYQGQMTFGKLFTDEEDKVRFVAILEANLLMQFLMI